MRVFGVHTRVFEPPKNRRLDIAIGERKKHKREKRDMETKALRRLAKNEGRIKWHFNTHWVLRACSSKTRREMDGG